VTPSPAEGHHVSPHPPKPFDAGAIEHVVMAGWTGRDADALEAHVRELAALGVPRPAHTPVFYPVAASLLTTSDAIQVVGNDTSGEVEFVLAFLDDDLWVGLGSDQTDRAVERTSVALSKQLCAKVAAPALWRYGDVEPHWDRLVLRAWAHRAGQREVYQEDTLAAIRPPKQLVALYEDTSARAMPASWALFGGTIAAAHGVAPADAFEMELDDPVLGRRLRHHYRIETLPVNS
jgi:hypothetical protein